MNTKVILGALRRRFNSYVHKATGFRLINRQEGLVATVTAVVNSTLQHKAKVCCVQVGAHDGRTNDHLHELRVDPRWSSYLLEPNPAVCGILRSNTRREKGTRILPFAMATKAGQLDLWTVHTARLPAHVRKKMDFSQVSSLERASAMLLLRAHLGFRGVPDDWIARTTVDVITWEILFRQHVHVAPDCVLIDAEGHDAALLETFPLQRFRPAVIVFEHHWMQPAEFESVSQRLREHGYALLPIRQDTVAVHADAWHEQYRDYPFERAMI